MAKVKKFPESAVVNVLRHNRREIISDRNRNINGQRTGLNYYLTPDHNGMTEYAYYKKRKSELYCYRRSDVKVMAGWVCYLPQNIVSPCDQRTFFQTTYDFLEERYGKENVIQAVIHYDECISVQERDVTGNAVFDENGRPLLKTLLGKPHLHFCFIPVVEDKKPAHLQHEKICANDVLSPNELRRFHNDYQRYLNSHGIQARVVNKLTDDNCPWDPSNKNDSEKSDADRLRDEIRKARRWT